MKRTTRVKKSRKIGRLRASAEQSGAEAREGAQARRFYKPLKKRVTLRLDADVLYTDEGAYIRPEDISPRISPAPAMDRPADAKSNSAHLENMLEDYERRVITETLRRNDYNVARAAVALGLGSRQTLYKKLKRLTINVGDFLQDEQQPGLQLRADPQLSK